MARFIADSAVQYGFSFNDLVAVGFSNGANIASAVMWDHPDVLRNAILLRPMLPYRTRTACEMPGSRVLISAGRSDPLVTLAEVDQLADRFRAAGASAQLVVQEEGHTLARADIDAARDWLQS